MNEKDEVLVAQGQRLAYCRKLANLKRDELAKEADVTGTSISLWENASSGSGMTSRSMEKIIAALKKHGVIITELWLKEGIGESPIIAKGHSFVKLAEEIHSNFDEALEELDINQENLIIKLATSFSKEIEEFASLSELSVITKLDNDNFAPILEKGDYVGGIWQKNFTFQEPKICIIKLDNNLTVGCVKKSNKDGVFDVSYSLNTQEHTDSSSLIIKNVKLKVVAPIIRVWRN